MPELKNRPPKYRLHRASGQALVTAVGDAMRSVTPHDCRGFFAGCGYTGTHYREML